MLTWRRVFAETVIYVYKSKHIASYLKIENKHRKLPIDHEVLAYIPSLAVLVDTAQLTGKSDEK